MIIENLTYTVGKDDPKKVIMDRLGKSLDGLELAGNRVLIATAPQPERTIGGIIRPDSNRDEQRWQGKVGLIVKIGEDAFKWENDYRQYEWKGTKYSVGDWVFFRTHDGSERGVGGISCRVIKDNLIEGRLSDPELVW